MQDIKDDEEDPYSYYVIPPFSFADENYKESSSNYSLDLRYSQENGMIDSIK